MTTTYLYKWNKDVYIVNAVSLNEALVKLKYLNRQADIDPTKILTMKDSALKKS